MALRTILTRGDETLEKKSKEVRDFGERTHTLLDDMWETMYEADGIGLAAPQVGVLRRAIVIDVTPPQEGDGSEGDPKDERDGGGEEDANDVKGDGAPGTPEPVRYELLNPVILESEGEACDKEGCLSVPGIAGYVKRPARVKVRAQDRNGGEIVVEGEGMLAKALSHEIDHLEGVLFTEIAERLEDASKEQGQPDE